MRLRALLNRTSAFLLILPALAGCVQVIDEPLFPGNCDDAPCYATLGWEAYEARAWDQFYLFQQAISEDSSYAEGYMGVAWFHIEHGFIALAQSEFQQAIELDPTLVAAYAGNAYTLAAMGILGDALTMADAALALGGEDYVFEHNPEVNGTSLHLLLASTFFRLGDYASAQVQVDIVLPGNGLDPQSPTYVPDLMLLIASLGGGE